MKFGFLFIIYFSFCFQETISSWPTSLLNYNVRFRSLCRDFIFFRGGQCLQCLQSGKKNVFKAFYSLSISQRGANQINPSLGLKPLICNLISGGCLGHEDTQQGQGLLYREICAFGQSRGFDQQSHPA